MKISLLKVNVTSPNGQQLEITTLGAINQALDKAGPQGLSVADFRARTKLDRAIEALAPEATELILSDVDYATLQKAVEQINWVGRSPVLNTLMSELFTD